MLKLIQMNLNECKKKIDEFNILINLNKKNGNAGKDIAMILLSARATIYLRKNELEKLEEVVKEIDEVFKSNQKNI